MFWWSLLVEFGFVYLVVKKFLIVDIIKYCSDWSILGSIKEGILKIKEELFKILFGNKF